MDIKYLNLKKQLDDTIKKDSTAFDFHADFDFPVWHSVKGFVLGKLQLHNLLNDCAAYCDHEEAIAFYKASLLIHYDQEEIYSKIAYQYYISNRKKKALIFINKALQKDPVAITSLELKQSILIDLGKLPEVIYLFEKIVSINPDRYTAYFNLGKAYVGMGLYEKAIQNLLKAIEINPDDKEIAFWIGKVYDFHLHDEVSAAKYYAMTGFIKDDD